MRILPHRHRVADRRSRNIRLAGHENESFHWLFANCFADCPVAGFIMFDPPCKRFESVVSYDIFSIEGLTEALPLSVDDYRNLKIIVSGLERPFQSELVVLASECRVRVASS